MDLKYLLKTVFLTFILFQVGVPTSQAQSLTDYTSIPPFLGAASIQPNILLLVDNSGSMNHCAYANDGVDGCLDDSGIDLSTGYISTQDYHGYFQYDKCYTYASNTFDPQGSRPCTNQWDGNFLNWVTMRRIDITKWVMTGGLCSSIRSSAKSCSKIKAQDVVNGYWTFYKQFDLTGLAPTSYNGTRCIQVSDQRFYVRSDSVCGGSTSTGDSFRVWIDGVVKQTGVIQDIGDSARFGVMLFDDDGNYHDGGYIAQDIGSNIVSLVNAVEKIEAETWTPLSEALYQAARYFAQVPPASFNSSAYTVSVNNDPYCFAELAPENGDTGCKNSTQGRWVDCCKSYVLLFTDGDPTNDTEIPTGIQDYAHSAGSHSSDHHDPCSSYFNGPSGAACWANGSHYLDDVAYWAHITDLRPSTGNVAELGVVNTNRLDNIQNLTLYPFFAFGTGSQLLKDAAKMGGFIDSNGNNLPDLQSEWDENNDGIPDTYFESTNASLLKAKLTEAILDIIDRASSGTSVSVLATSAEGEGAVYQSFFNPSINEGNGARKWLGNLHGLFIDAFGNLREDTDNDGALVLETDLIVKSYFNTSTQLTTFQMFADTNGDGAADSATPISTSTLFEMGSFWNAGRKLAEKVHTTRTIYTWINANHDSVVDTNEFTTFVDSKASTLRPYLRATDDNGSGSADDEAADIINFIRGADIVGMRERGILINGTEKVWKLGDIVYSTPIVSAAPRERYDLIYGDETYRTFYNTYKDRRQVVYVGANDGMLHAFNGGFYTPGDDSSTTAVEHGRFTDTTGKTLGEELWGYVPYELLPHLKWLTMEDYTHVYYVDLTPKITDVKLWPETGDSTHPGGWGTILIGGMRFGGKPITVTDAGFPSPTTRTFQSAYFVLDITDPESAPVLLASFTDSQLGFTTSFPSVLRVSADPSNSAAAVKWFMMAGSGPTTYDAQSTQNARIKIFDLALSSPIAVSTLDTGRASAFMGDSINVDGNLDYSSDVGYIGDNFYAANKWKGDLHRINIQNSTTPLDPSTWTRSTFFNIGNGTGPITAAPTASLGTNNQMWVYFGTGRYLASGDESDTDPQRFYGIKDPCWKDISTCNNDATTVTDSELRDVTLIDVKTDGSVLNGGSDTTFSALVTTAQSSTYDGWYINLALSERVLSKSLILGGTVFFTSFIPEANSCTAGGTSYINAVFYETGTSGEKSFFEDPPPDDGDPPAIIARQKVLGEGVPSAIAIHIGTADGDSGGDCKGGVKGFIQQSTGMITEICGDSAFSIRSGIKGWRDF
ncbi:hypothetical protein JYT87_00130 [Nitrospira defluvii]|nr:hypothetical protein [Nitrospira defluvii]